jgi:dynein heavy chain 1
VDNEFTGLMKKVASKPLIVEVMSIAQVHKTLERMSEQLQRIQKALGDYLET